MKKLLPLLLLFLAQNLVTPLLQAQQTLATLVDKNRVLLIFAPADLDRRYTQQLDLLAHHTAELRARDLVLLPLTLQSGAPVSSNTLRDLNPPRISDDEQLTLRRRFHIAQTDFAVVLLGKDGGEKLRSHTPLTLERLNRTIDAMPMRRQEMRTRH